MQKTNTPSVSEQVNRAALRVALSGTAALILTVGVASFVHRGEVGRITQSISRFERAARALEWRKQVLLETDHFLANQPLSEVIAQIKKTEQDITASRARVAELEHERNVFIGNYAFLGGGAALLGIILGFRTLRPIPADPKSGPDKAKV